MAKTNNQINNSRLINIVAAKPSEIVLRIVHVGASLLALIDDLCLVTVRGPIGGLVVM